MHDDTMAGSTAAKGSVRTLTTQELPLLREHLLRLDRDSRRDRFNGYADETFIARYAAKCESDGTVIVAYIEDGVVRGAAELHQPDLSNVLPEIAFSVEAQLRRRGVGTILFTKLDRDSTKSLEAIDSLRITTGSQNEAMRVLAHKFGADLAFRRGESSGSIDLTQRKTADLPAPSLVTPADAARAMMNFNRACWSAFFRIYGFGRTASIAGGGFGHAIGFGQWSALSQKCSAVFRSKALQSITIGLRPDTLVVAEFSAHAALDHDRALRALFACNHACRTRSGAAGLLDFGLHGFERHPHQRGGDLGLLLEIVGNSHGGEDGFIQRWRIAPDAP